MMLRPRWLGRLDIRMTGRRHLFWGCKRTSSDGVSAAGPRATWNCTELTMVPEHRHGRR